MQNTPISRKRFFGKIGATLVAGLSFIGLSSVVQATVSSESAGNDKKSARCCRDPRVKAYRGPDSSY
jgi:hypothetical protein